jgi:hypothetical protein
MKKSAGSTSTLLLDERPLMVLPKLATMIGLHEAIVLQQIHFLLQMESSGRVIDGEKWVWNTLESWQREHFPFLSLRTLRRAIDSLERFGLLVSCQPDGRVSRRKYYRINYKSLPASSQYGQNGQMNMVKLDRLELAIMDSSYTETTSETPTETTSTKESKGTAVPSETAARDFSSDSRDFSSDSPDIDATWQPSEKRHMTKEQLLAKIKPSTDYPSEDEFNNYLEDGEFDNIVNARDLYYDLCARKWRHWKPDLKRWTKIRDWRKYVLALEETMQEAKTR